MEHNDIFIIANKNASICRSLVVYIINAKKMSHECRLASKLGTE